MNAGPDKPWICVLGVTLLVMTLLLAAMPRRWYWNVRVWLTARRVTRQLKRTNHAVSGTVTWPSGRKSHFGDDI